jgi:hypothetical protein
MQETHRAGTTVKPVPILDLRRFRTPLRFVQAMDAIGSHDEVDAPGQRCVEPLPDRRLVCVERSTFILKEE